MASLEILKMNIEKEYTSLDENKTKISQLGKKYYIDKSLLRSSVSPVNIKVKDKIK